MKILDILQVAVPASTPLTVTSEIKMLELLGVVKDPQLVNAMQLVSSLTPTTAQATLKGLVQLLSSLMRMSGKATSAHHQTINTVLTELEAIPDTTLTFGTFLAICQSLLEASGRTTARPRARA
jgi:hypothetical protein